MFSLIAPQTTTAAPETTASTAAPETTASTAAPETTASTAAPETTASTAAPTTGEYRPKDKRIKYRLYMIRSYL